MIMSTEKKNKNKNNNIAIQTVAAASMLISFCVPLRVNSTQLLKVCFEKNGLEQELVLAKRNAVLMVNSSKSSLVTSAECC